MEAEPFKYYDYNIQSQSPKSKLLHKTNPAPNPELKIQTPNPEPK